VFKNGKANGACEIRKANNYYYSGEMVDDLQQGFGIEILPNGTQYTGLFTAGKKGPHGTIQFVDGNIYKGEVSQNAINGYGRLVYANQGQYLG